MKKEYDKISRKRMLRLMSAYASIMLLILVCAVITMKEEKNSVGLNNNSSTDIVTEYVYINSNQPTYVLPNDTTERDDEMYTVREYMDQIGIFSSDGTLIKILDVYIKTLPETDRRLLKEGIEVLGKVQLNSIIEDYTS